MTKITKPEIKQLFTKARRILKHPGLDLLIAPTQAVKGRLMVITPGRIGNAVQRNTIRRRIKELFRKEKLDQKGYDCIAIIKKAGTQLKYDQLKTIISNALDASNR